MLMFSMVIFLPIYSIVLWRHYLTTGHTMTGLWTLALNANIGLPMNSPHFINSNSYASLLRAGQNISENVYQPGKMWVCSENVGSKSSIMLLHIGTLFLRSLMWFLYCTP